MADNLFQFGSDAKTRSSHEDGRHLSEPRLDPAANMAKFIEQAKRFPALQGIEWEALIWVFDADDPVARKTSKHRDFRNELMFSNRETSTREWARKGMDARAPMVKPFLDFARAIIRTQAQNSSPGITVLRKTMAVLGVLEKVLRDRSAVPDPTTFLLNDFLAAESLLSADYAKRTAYKMTNILENIAETVDRLRLASNRIGYKTGLKRPDDGDELTEEGQTSGSEKMISDEALEALATISANPKGEVETLMIRVLDLLVCGGFRIGEVLSLPVDCLVEENGRLGIRYAPKKLRELEVKWIPTASDALARRAISDLTARCKEARDLAGWMATHPGRIRRLAGLLADSEIDVADAMKLLGLAPDGTSQFIAQHGIDATVEGGRLRARVGEIERALSARFDDAPLVIVKSGREIRLKDALIVIFENELHAHRGTMPFLPRSLTITMLAKALERALIGKTDSSGQRISIRTHSIRHWLNTLASNEGISDIDLALWSGRKNVQQNEAYKHLKLTTRTKLAREMILDGGVSGSVARIANTINDPIEREKYVTNRVQAAHTSPYGACFHPFAASPCTRHLQCLAGANGKGCSELGRTKGNQQERDALLKLKGETEDNLARAKQAMSDGSYNASNWVTAQKNTLSGITTALAVDDLPDLPAGGLARVFPDGAKNHESK